MRKLIIKRKSLVVQYEVGPPTSQRRYSCAECRREFRSVKALHGHLRVHPSKGYRGVSRPTKKTPIKNVQETDADVIAAAEIMMTMLKHDDDDDNNGASAAYHCGVCHRCFGTHQALGGHMASHNKHKKSNEESGPAQPRNEEAAVHECDVCGKVFDKGVSLGGHKRKHFLERERAKESGIAAVPKSPSTNRPLYLDLNVVPDVEETS